MDEFLSSADRRGDPPGMLGRAAVVLRPRTAAIIANGIRASRLRRKNALSPAESTTALDLAE